MDKLTYQEIIKRILKEHAQYRSQSDDSLSSQVVFDDEQGHYLLLDVGWYEKNIGIRIPSILISYRAKFGFNMMKLKMALPPTC